MQTSFAWLRKSAPVLFILFFILSYPIVGPLVRYVTEAVFGVHSGADTLGNASGAAIAADQLAGSGVQLNTFFTKLWITISFFIVFCVLPFWMQSLTHPAPTKWAKEEYKDDFADLSIEDKFASYGRLQLILTIKIVGAGLVAALLV